MNGLNIKNAKLILEVEIDGREAKLEFDLNEEEINKVMKILEPAEIQEKKEG